MPFTADCDEYLVYKPRIVQTPLAAPKTLGEGPAELETPLANGLVGNLDTALGKELLDVTQALGKAVIQPYRVGNDLWRKSAAMIQRLGGVHTVSVPDRQLS